MSSSYRQLEETAKRAEQVRQWEREGRFRPNKAGLVALRMLRGMTPYQVGEIAGFDPALAIEMVTDGAAELFEPNLPAK